MILVDMHETRSVTEIARHFADYINRVVYRRERFVLMRGNKPVAELGPLPAGKRLTELPDLLASLPRLSEAEAEQFADDLAEARSVLSTTDVLDPWAS
jgi:antitoxin (DNA-binding transcriptional repressor) of toxin-antitoxin stability system